MTLDLNELHHLLRRVQDGTLRRSQICDLGGADHDIARMLRRRDLTSVHPGVYVDHTGDLSWQQRAWCAVHTYWPAALARQTALPNPDHRGPLHVAIDVRRTVRRLPGIVAHRTTDFSTRVLWLQTPPRIAPEHAIIDVLGQPPVEQAFQALADLCHTRRTHIDQIRCALNGRGRVIGRDVIEGLLGDLETGTCSVLERGYSNLVERTHGLPRGDRQVAFVNGIRPGYHDVKYSRFGLVVELDGRAFHNTVQGWNDSYERDLGVAVQGSRTARLSYRQVFTNPCHTARQIGALMQQGGWTGAASACLYCPSS